MSLETMTKLATYTVGSGGESSITFSNIPQTYTDLKILLSVRASSASGNSNCFIYLNGVTGTSYSQIRTSSAGTGTPTSDNQTLYPWIDLTNAIPNATYTASTFANAEISIFNYTGNRYKSLLSEFVGENSATAAYQYITVGLFTNTSAITSLTIDGTDNFVQYSTATLYGVKAQRTAVGNSIKATGGAIAFDGTYVYHVFNATDTFTPTRNLSCQILTIAGGGAGGGHNGSNHWGGGGGGAGGLYYSETNSLLPTSYGVTVGAGGAYTLNASGSYGSDSQFSGLTTAVGGGGGARSTGTAGTSTGSAGGSGGGGGYTGTGGAATSGQGNVGGNGSANWFGGGAGGGGAGGAGETLTSNGPNDFPGNGGVGTSAYSSWGKVTGLGHNVLGTYYFAGGGGGGNYADLAYNTYAGGSDTNYSYPWLHGIGGYGGGGAGQWNLYDDRATKGVNGAVGTGGGGGGCGGINTQASYPPGNGGSGVVIVRYKA